MEKGSHLKFDSKAFLDTYNSTTHSKSVQGGHIHSSSIIPFSTLVEFFSLGLLLLMAFVALEYLYNTLTTEETRKRHTNLISFLRPQNLSPYEVVSHFVGAPLLLILGSLLATCSDDILDSVITGVL